MRNPALVGEERKSDAAVEQVLAEEIARRLGADLRRDLEPRLVAATFLAAVHAALQFWLDAPPGATLHQTIGRALDHLRLGPPAG